MFILLLIAVIIVALMTIIMLVNPDAEMLKTSDAKKSNYLVAGYLDLLRPGPQGSPYALMECHLRNHKY